jgi:magnesium-transporting ATPase (P-type)
MEMTFMRKGAGIMENYVSYIAFCCLGFFVIYQSLSIKAASALFPILLSVSLIIFNLLTLILRIFFRKSTTKNKQEVAGKSAKQEESLVEKKKLNYEIFPFIAIVFCLLFIVGFQKIGFDISAFLLTFATMILINPKEGFRKYYIALLIPFLLILLFKFGLNLRIPLLAEQFFG